MNLDVLSRRAAVLLAAASVILWTAGCATTPAPTADAMAASFRIAMIPDTQNYLDYTHQKGEGFAFDASEQFIQQMEWIAARSSSKGGDIVFVASVGDVWQHQSKPIDEAHLARGLDRLEKSFFGEHFAPTPRVLDVEIPKAVEGYALLDAAGLPFGVAPGNHDYDAMWNVVGFPPNFDKNPAELTMTPEDIGMLHIGGLDNFRSVFGADQRFFADKEWYVASFRGGANSAQIFEAGGYRFLHVALEMQPDDDVLAWVESVLDEYPGLPTILTTHDYMDSKGRRMANPIIDLDRVDPDHHNGAEALFTKLVMPNDQIFLLLCGHHHGQSMRVDENAEGHAIYQILADYQDRGQSGLDAGQPPQRMPPGPVGIGDGWFRLLEFDLAGETPKLSVRTYSTHYGVGSRDLDDYAAWYRHHEQPEMSDAEFHAADDFELELSDFRERFGAPVGAR